MLVSNKNICKSKRNMHNGRLMHEVGPSLHSNDGFLQKHVNIMPNCVQKSATLRISLCTFLPPEFGRKFVAFAFCFIAEEESVFLACCLPHPVLFSNIVKAKKNPFHSRTFTSSPTTPQQRSVCVGHGVALALVCLQVSWWIPRGTQRVVGPNNLEVRWPKESVQRSRPRRSRQRLERWVW